MRLLLACTCLALLAGSDETGISDFVTTPAMASAIVSEAGATPTLLEAGSRALGGFGLGFGKTLQDDPAPGESSAAPNSTERREFTRDAICDTLASAAQSNDLPPKFFMRLIWQESKLNPMAVSPAGAQGVAQFMPRIAAAFGINDPFDPTQALPASARFLKSLVNQFGNLGLAAAAYNGGSGRIQKWLDRRGKLPKETRTYVLNITGQAPERWVGSASRDLRLEIPARAPCRQHAAFLPDPNAPAESDNTKVTEVASPDGRLLIASNARTQRLLKRMQASERGRATLRVLASKAKTRSTTYVVASIEKRRPAPGKAAAIVTANAKAPAPTKVAVNDKRHGLADKSRPEPRTARKPGKMADKRLKVAAR